ncbi:uncharacterized protein LOC127278700 [Leptopilina boulardi]|uniref:uncharacterized protein LOC127278700 n=1 Tax=Leptopilina boulardi TaxID=63433 RepID=UPI0021F5BCC4|nr:uncharacterized protein LOC127278700 [Leptopilina boulardi]
MNIVEKVTAEFAQASIYDFDANELYFPNMCHVCQCYGENAVNLKRCSACEMISYCCEEHQIKDWQNHKQFCKVIRQIKNEWGVDNIFKSLKSTYAKESLHTLKNFEDKMIYYESLFAVNKCLLTRSMELLQRKLKKIEFEMIQFPRVCAVCYESKQELLTNCKKCPQSSFCKEHLNDPSHKSECMKFISCFNSQINEGLDDTCTILSNVMNNMTSPFYPKVKKLPDSITQFLETRLSLDLATLKISNTLFTEEMKSIYNPVLSNRYSWPFTLLYAIEKLGLHLHSMVIHVIGSAILELFADWEMIFHFLPQMREIKVILIGPELMVVDRKIQEVCDLCKKKKKKLIFEKIKTMYDKYCIEKSYFNPDMIVCFNPGFHVYETWHKSVKLFNKVQCPLLVTALNTTEGLLDKSYIDLLFPSAKCIYNDINPFASIQYSREYILLPIAVKNQFMILYEFLDSKED